MFPSLLLADEVETKRHRKYCVVTYQTKNFIKFPVHALQKEEKRLQKKNYTVYTTVFLSFFFYFLKVLLALKRTSTHTHTQAHTPHYMQKTPGLAP